MTMDFTGLPSQLTQNGSTAEFVLADKVMYLKMPFLSGMLPGGKQWMKIDVAAAAKQAGTSLGSFGQLDPQQWLQQLLASNDTQKVGTDTVQGEQMTHYRTTIDPATALSKVPAAQRAAVRKAMQQIGMSTIPVDVWVDGSGLLRRESLSLTFGQGLQNAAMKVTFDLHDFGSPVNVEVPPTDQVYDALSALKGGFAPYLKQKR
jgi:LppX_LprAFG lipoprotein